MGMLSAAQVHNRATDKRTAERRNVCLPARLTWKDARGTMRFASAIARNISEFGVYVECLTPVSIPLFRLVHVQIERDNAVASALPAPLVRGRVLAAVYRISAPSMAKKQGLALRLMVDPRSMALAEPARATA